MGIWVKVSDTFDGKNCPAGRNPEILLGVIAQTLEVIAMSNFVSLKGCH